MRRSRLTNEQIQTRAAQYRRNAGVEGILGWPVKNPEEYRLVQETLAEVY